MYQDIFCFEVLNLELTDFLVMKIMLIVENFNYIILRNDEQIHCFDTSTHNFKSITKTFISLIPEKSRIDYSFITENFLLSIHSSLLRNSTQVTKKE